MSVSGFYRRPHKWYMAGAIVLLTAAVLLSAGEGLASSGGGHGEDAAPKGWVATDTFRVMNFVVLAVALFFVLKKPMSNALNARITGIREQLSTLEAKKKEAEDQLAQYNARLSGLEKEAEKIIQEYIQQGEEARKRILAEAASTAEKLETQAKKHIEHEFKQAREKLQQDIVEKALIRAEAIIAAKIDQKDQERLVDEYVEKVVA